VRKIDGRSGTRVIARKTRMRAIIDGRQILRIPARPRSEKWSGGCARSQLAAAGAAASTNDKDPRMIMWKTANRSAGRSSGAGVTRERFAEHTYQWLELAD